MTFQCIVFRSRFSCAFQSDTASFASDADFAGALGAYEKSRGIAVSAAAPQERHFSVDNPASS